MKNKENLRNYIWNYFQLHASQRLTTFNFYIVISTLMMSGFFVVIQSIPGLGLILGMITTLMSFVFWKLDVRNKQLIKNSENALKYIENTDSIAETEEARVLNIFRYEEAQTKRIRERRFIAPWKWFFSYSTCFNIVYAVFALLGLIGLIYAIVVICLGVPEATG